MPFIQGIHYTIIKCCIKGLPISLAFIKQFCTCDIYKMFQGNILIVVLMGLTPYSMLFCVMISPDEFLV